MNKLIFIPTEGAPREVPPEEYGALEYGSPTFTYMRRALHCSTIEHLSCLFDGHVVHMFFDEEGLLDKSKMPNDRASAIAGNRQLRGPRAEKLRYNDLAKEPPHPLTTMFVTGMMIVGDVFIWTGDME